MFDMLLKTNASQVELLSKQSAQIESLEQRMWVGGRECEEALRTWKFVREKLEMICKRLDIRDVRGCAR